MAANNYFYFILQSHYCSLLGYLYESPYFFTQPCTVLRESAFSFVLASFGGGMILLESVSRVCANNSCKESTTRHRKLCDLSKISSITWNADNRISEWSLVSCFINASCNGCTSVSSALKHKAHYSVIENWVTFLPILANFRPPPQLKKCQYM